MHRLRTVTFLDVSAVAGHHAMPAALLLFFFVRFGFFIKKFTFRILCIRKFHLSQPPTPEKIIHLCIILWILVQSDIVSDLILLGGHCDLYIMVQRFCLVSLTISDRKTSYRSLKGKYYLGLCAFCLRNFIFSSR